MVLESIVNRFLDQYLRDYVENLDTKKLKIDLWGGNVELENLYLKPNALADLNLPVTISIGYLQKLTLQIPWKNPYASPTKAAIDGLYLLIVPKTEVEFDPKREEKEQYEAKMRELEKIERLRKEKEEAENDTTAAKNNDTFVERMQLAIIRNLELSIRNIHIVYEDQSTKPGHPFSMGITLNYITLHTTTADWKPTILTEDTPLTHKLGDLSALTIYWNSNATPRSNLSREEAIKNLREHIAVNNDRAPTDISYILRPMNMKAMIKLVMKPRQDGFKRPMFDIKVDLDDISLNINRNQYSDILDLLDFQDYLTLKSKYQKYQIKDVPEEKRSVQNWKFAYNVIVNENVRPRFECYKWENIKAHRDRKREYHPLRVLILTNKATEEQKQRAQDLEKKLDVFNLTYIRRSAEIEAKKRQEKEPKTWWGSVSNWWGGAATNEDPNSEKVMTDEEKKKLFEAIGYDGDDTTNTNYPKEYIDFDLNVRLQLLDVNIWSKLNDDDAQFRIVTRVSIPDTGVHFQRRPAAEAMAVFVDLGSFQVFGIATDLNDKELSFKTRPVLAQPVNVIPTSSKLLQIEFETNPLNKKSDYRVKVVSQSLEIKYNAPTINKLNEFFEQDTQRNLQTVKQAAYSTYADVKQRSFILMKHNVEKIKVLDIDVDINSTYFLLSENGIYQENAPTICMDFGHLIIQRDSSKGIETTLSRETMSIDEAREKSYTQFKLNLTDVQLIYVHQNESWQNAREAKNTPFHLIKPMSLALDLGKCIYSDDSVLPAYKVAGKIPDINLRMSDKRLFQILNHIQSIPLPQSKHPQIADADKIDAESIADVPGLASAEKTLETVEAMTPMMKKKKEEEEEKNAAKPKKTFEGQLTTLEASFRLDTIGLHIDEAMGDGVNEKPFLCIELKSIVAQTKLKTFDMEFQASLGNFIVYHQQFVGKDNQYLRLLSAQLDQTKSDDDQRLISVHLLHTSPENPSFNSSTYNSIENNADLVLNKLAITLKLEALLSIMRFQDALMKRLPQSSSSTPTVAPIKEEKVVKKTDAPTSTSLKVNAVLKEFRILLESKEARVFDIQVQGVKANVSQVPEKMLINLILSDLRIFDPNKEARYRKIISQQGDDQDLLQVDLSLFSHPANYSKPVDVFDCDIKVIFAKANIVFLYKHIGAMMAFLDSLNVTKAALDIATSQADAAMEQVQKLQEQAYKVHLDITFNAPTIIIPTKSSSDQALFVDLGQLTMKTTFENDPKRFLIEHQNIRLENIRASRVQLDEENQIRGEVSLLECADLKTDIQRLLYPDRVKDEPGLTIKVDWESVHFRLAKDDYACVMAVLTENFSENLKDSISEGSRSEQFRYQQEEQEKEEEQLRDAVVQKQKALQTTDEVKPTMKIRAEIQKLALTLYLGESNLTSGQTNRNDDLKLANVQISTFEAEFRQKSDSSYKANARVKNFFLDDLRVTNKAGSVTRMMDRHFTLDPNAFMLVTTFEFKPKTAEQNTVVRQLTAKLESLYFCISLDFLMTLQEFFLASSPAPVTEVNPTTTTEEKPAIKPATTNDDDMETTVNVIVQNPQIILLEDQRNPNCNCLVLDMGLNSRLITVSTETKIYAQLKHLTVYSSNFAELKRAGDAESKVKYRILQPANIDFMMSSNPTEQKIDVRMTSIIVSIAPAPLKTLIAVTSSLGTVKTEEKEVPKSISTQSLFTVKKNDDGNFWFLQKSNEDKTIEQTKIVEPTITMIQQLVLMLDSIEVKVEVGLGSLTKSVIAMCLSNITADVKNWSSDMSMTSALSVEAALFNERVHSWEPFIEPTNEKGRKFLTPWALTCAIEPPNKKEKEKIKSIYNVLPMTNLGEKGSVAKQMIFIRADQLLNITMTKTGLELLQRVSTLFTDVYNQRLPIGADEEDQPLLSIVNRTGKDFRIDQLQRLQFLHDRTATEMNVKDNDVIPLFIPGENNATVARLSVMNEADHLRREEFSIYLENHREVISIHRMWKRVYNIVPTADESFPKQVLCDIQSHNDRRQVVLSSVLRVFNHTTMPLLVLDIDSKTAKPDKSVGRINVNEDFYVPIDFLYANSNGSIAFGVDESDGIPTDFFSFNWKEEFTMDRQLKLKDGSIAYFVPFKEVITCYAENTDDLVLPTFNLHIYPALHLTNLLPIGVECSIDDNTSISLNSSQTEILSSGHKTSTLNFIIPSYNNARWVSEPAKLINKSNRDHNELLVIFRKASATTTQGDILRMVLRVETFHTSYRLQLYASFWILNRTNLRLDFQVDNIISSISTSETPFLISSDKFGVDASKKGQIRVLNGGQNEATAAWSEKFSMDVIQSTGMAMCKIANDRIYTICVDINTSTFGVTKLVTLLPATIIVNRSSIDLEVIEVNGDKEIGAWETVAVEQFLPYWPKLVKDSLMRVRYKHNQKLSIPFKINAKHQTLLQIDDEERSAIHVEVTATDFNGVRVIFQDYRIGDAPVLIINGLDKDLTFSQVDDVQYRRTHMLPGGNYVYYTWSDPVKPRQLIVSYERQNAKLSLEPICGQMKLADNRIIRYAVFVDGAQTILLFHSDDQIIQTVSGASLAEDILDQRIQMDICEMGLSIIDDTRKEELLYISLTQSNVVWTESTGRRVKPLSDRMNEGLEKLYLHNLREREIHPEDRDLLMKKYPLEDVGEVVFHGEQADLITGRDKKHKTVQRQALPGLWIEYGASKSKTTFHIKINRLQIDNQMETTLFPVTFHPIKPKASGNEFVDKPFLELSVYRSNSTRADIMQFKYVQLLVQEFAVKIDQGLIMAMLLFFKPADTNTTPTIDMKPDLERLQKSLDEIIKPQIDNPLNETEMYFERLHLSPLKIHVSFSLHGDTQSGDLLAMYPLFDFLLRTLNVAEVQDVILRLGYYERLSNKFSQSRLTTEVSNHYQVQFMKQLHVLVLGLDVLGNPFGVIRGVAEGVESFFYEPYKGAIEGPLEFAEGVATGVRNLLGSTIGGAAGAVSKITGVLGKGLATLTFDDDYKTSRIRRREPGGNFASDIAIGGKNVVSGFVGGVTGVVMQPVKGAKEGTAGFFKGLGKGMVGLITRPAGGIVDFASTAFDAVKRTAQSEEVIRRIRHPRHVREDGVIRPYVPQEATGFYLLNRIAGGDTEKYGTYVAHIVCSENPFSWLMATTTCLVFLSEISFLGSYEVDWLIEYNELAEVPTIREGTTELQILTKEVKRSGTIKSHRVYGKSVKCRSISDAKLIIEKIAGAMHIAGI